MSEPLPDVATPLRGFAPFADILTSRAVPGLLAGLAVRLSRRNGRPLSFGNRVIAVRHTDVTEVLRRDLDFLIAPVNATRIEGVMGPFILGMDGGPTLHAQREALYGALENAGVALIGGPDFGVLGEGYIRLSYANSEENILRALERMRVFLEKAGA